MKLKILYFASLREKVGKGSEEIDVAATTVDDLQRHLVSRGGPWAEAFAGKGIVRVAVNQDMAQGSAALKAGDEVAFFPPVTGG